MASLPDVEVTPSTLFYTGSTTKSFTAAVVSLLIDDTANSTDPLTWQTPLSSLIRDDFVLSDDWTTNHVTLEDALSHRTGMPRHDLSYGGKNFTLRDGVRSFRHLPFTAEIRTTFQYCNLMYLAVSHAIETYTKSWLGDLFYRRIWEPLDMLNTHFSLENALVAASKGGPPLAEGYAWMNQTQEHVSVPWLDVPFVSGAGLIISNVLDYAKWLKCHIDNAYPLSEAGHKELHAARIHMERNEEAPFTGPQSYALGWMTANYRGEPVMFHGGSVTGFGALMLYLPHRKWGVAMMGNTFATANVATLILSLTLLDNLLDTPAAERASPSLDIDKTAKKASFILDHSGEVLFPDAPRGTHALSLTLPLGSYAGQYCHGGYRNLTLVVKDRNPSSPRSRFHQSTQGLQAEAYDRTWPIILDFEHVSGEFFVVRTSDAYTYRGEDEHETSLQLVSKAEFRLGPDGKVRKLGIWIEAGMGDEAIWFTKL